jgi:hypothetical protein
MTPGLGKGHTPSRKLLLRLPSTINCWVRRWAGGRNSVYFSHPKTLNGRQDKKLLAGIGVATFYLRLSGLTVP